MKKFIIYLVYFFIPILIYIIFALVFLPNLLTASNGPDTEKQIRVSFKNVLKKEYETLILGNSRLYRATNPDFFSKKTYNFSHDNDTYNQLYYKLIYLKKNGKKFKNLILGVDYFQFGFISDTRNYIYGDLLGKGYLSDYKTSYYTYYLKNKLDNINPKRLKLLFNAKKNALIRDNGQFILPGKAKESDKIIRESIRLDIQINYFEKIIQYCNHNNIRVFIVMLPVRGNELKSYKKKYLSEFDLFLNKYKSKKPSITILQYTYDKSYTINDYTDITHLNENAANRFSKQLNDTIQKIIDIKK